jgi:UDP-N-acetylmuramoyl-tripeptide--D-alanyl-D-alanine ligase
MPTFDPELLARWTDGTWTCRPAVAPTGFGIDTRTLAAGQVFVALRTAQRDGHDFLAAACAAGAAAALVSTAQDGIDLPQLVVADPLTALQAIAREHRRVFPGPVVGITGSAGKTSTKNLLARLLGDRALATEGNLNNHLGVPLTLTRLDPVRHDFAVIEAGIGGVGEMAPLAAMIEPDVALVTLVGEAHTEALGGLEGVAREKAGLPARVRGAGVAIFPETCRAYGPFRQLPVRCMTIERADVLLPTAPRADHTYFTVTHREEQTALTIAYPAEGGRPLLFTLPRVTDGMAQNAVLAVCAALWLGLAPALIQERLMGWVPAALRGEIRRDGERTYYLDCYNANPASMADALATFVTLPASAAPRLYVLGNMEELGPGAAEHHRQLGLGLRLRPGDHVCVIGPQAGDVRAGALAAGAGAGQVEIIADLAPAAARLRAWRGAVFLKGSRRYRLETVLDQPQTAATPAALASC